LLAKRSCAIVTIPLTLTMTLAVVTVVGVRNLISTINYNVEYMSRFFMAYIHC